MTANNRLDENLYISKQERKEKEVFSEGSFTYGEIDFLSFAEIFMIVAKKYAPCNLWEGGVFYDLGSGSGKACLAAALLWPFDVCRGIELQVGVFEKS